MLDAHPDWRLVFQEGSSGYFADLALYDAKFKAFWHHVQENWKDHTFREVADGLSMLADGRTAMSMGLPRLTGT